MFFGVLYYLRHPLLALERIHAVYTGTLLMQNRQVLQHEGPTHCGASSVWDQEWTAG
jgi:hypothetical protein